ncbi:MAG: tRNA pseudouridine(38-40) synthase TruA [Candidatus Edwardsbacteria bacterium]|nr:tRNA pseudouridine(38-40) synthase TruA [Candidatus Edwardsbacteria bacterium]
MRNIKLTIEYDGTSFSGWQVQPGKRTVQGVLEQKLSEMLEGPVTLHGSGRTDAGVHAKGQAANFKTDKTIPVQAFTKGLNAILPRDIAIHDAEEMPEAFQARFDATARMYRYRIVTERSPLAERYAWRMTYQVDTAILHDVAGKLIGKQDLEAFTCSQAEIDNFVVDVRHSEWKIGDGQYTYVIKADRFLHNLVRILVGTMVDMARGKIDPAAFDAIMRSKDRTKAGKTAPPQGLCLMEVFY